MKTLTELKAIVTNVETVGEKLTGTQLVTIYNEVSETPIKKFKDKATGIQSVLKVVNSKIDELSETKEAPLKENKIPAKEETKVEKPKFNATYAYTKQRDLLAELKSKSMENFRFGLTVIGKNGDDGLLRDRISVKLKGKRDAIGTISVQLGTEEATQTLHLNDELIVLNESTIELNEMVQIVSDKLDEYKSELDKTQAEESDKVEETTDK